MTHTHQCIFVIVQVKELMKIWQATGEASVAGMLEVLDEMEVEEAGAMRKKVKEALKEGKGMTLSFSMAPTKIIISNDCTYE